MINIPYRNIEIGCTFTATTVKDTFYVMCNIEALINKLKFVGNISQDEVEIYGLVIDAKRQIKEGTQCVWNLTVVFTPAYSPSEAAIAWSVREQLKFLCFVETVEIQISPCQIARSEAA